MKYEFFHICVRPESASVQALNRFLSSHRVLEVDRRFIDAGVHSGWAICVSYDPGERDQNTQQSAQTRTKIDYKDVLSDQDFAIFSRLRDLRKQIAGEEGVPVYSVFNNAQLAEIVEAKVDSLKAMSGIGRNRTKPIGKIWPVIAG